jgi:hypothetical protein
VPTKEKVLFLGQNLRELNPANFEELSILHYPVDMSVLDLNKITFGLHKMIKITSEMR